MGGIEAVACVESDVVCQRDRNVEGQSLRGPLGGVVCVVCGPVSGGGRGRAPFGIGRGENALRSDGINLLVEEEGIGATGKVGCRPLGCRCGGRDGRVRSKKEGGTKGSNAA